jgi:RNA-binding protein
MTAVPPTNPKKKSLMPSGELRRRLRGFAHKLSPIVQIGKEGVTQAVIRQVTVALHDHELIKVKLGGETPEDRFAAAESLGGQPGVNVVQIVGRVIVLYKRHPEKPQYEGANKKSATPDSPAPEPEPAKKKRAKPVSRKPAPRPAPRPRATSRGAAPRGRGGRRARP